MSRLAIYVEQITLGRRYTEELLGTIDPGDWFRMPAEGVTHVAWQVGHLTIAEYRLALERVRGARPEDEALISPRFLAAFGRDSKPMPDPAAYPTVPEIRAVFDRVHGRVLAELAETPESVLDEPLAIPHRICRNKAEVLAWCGRHEMVHAGQIGLLRRLLGYKPIW